MLLTLLAGIIVTHLFNPLFANFERQVDLKQALQGQVAAAVSGPASPSLGGPVRVNEENLGPLLTSESSLVIDQTSRQVLWSDDIHSRRPIASLTKLMTALVFLDENPDLTSEFTLGSADVAGAGVRYINAGETVLLKDLLFTALVASDNNAAQSLVRASGLSEEDFIRHMNAKAKNLGMLNTNFVEPTGLYYANISSVQDVTLLLEEALKNDLIVDILPLPEYNFTAVSGQAHRVFSTDKLLSSYLDVVGGKTGYNDEALYNFAAAIAGDKGQVLLIVSLGSSSADARFQDVKAMADWSFRNYIWP